MSAIKEILARKGTGVFTISPTATVLDAALLMNEHKIGGLVVVEDGKVIGMFTERDILQRIVAAKADPEQVRVADVMTTKITTCPMQTTIDQARMLMMKRRVRHLPIVTADRRLEGLISIGDVNAYQLDEEIKVNHALQQYLYERT
jgi:CBS domain-containing protein